MNRYLKSGGVGVGLVLLGMAGGFQLRAQAPAAAPTKPAEPDMQQMRADYEKWRTDFKTWGKWAPIGQESNGTTHLITPQKVLSALKLVKSGTVISLGADVPEEVAADVGANGVFKRTMLGIRDTGSADSYSVSYHGLTMSHVDSFCHFFQNGQEYNGVPVSPDTINAEAGCKKNGIMMWANGIVTRAVLYDIAGMKGVDWIEPGTPIRRADLEAWEKKSGLKAGPGDIILLYTGRWKRREKVGPYANDRAGYYADTIPWLHERLPAFVGHDFNIDWNPRTGWEGMPDPIHLSVLNWMGINIVECLNLEKAVEQARRTKQYEFLMMFAPLRVPGGTGSPVNPIAIF